MKSFKLVMITILIISLLGSFLVGCGGSNTPAEDSNETESSQAKNVDNQKETEEKKLVQLKTLLNMKDEEAQKFFDAFKEKYPDEKIEFEQIPLTGTIDEMLDKISLMMVSGSDVDILTMNNDDFYERVYMLKALEPLDSYIGKANVEMDSLKNIMKKAEREGYYYALPYRNSVWVTYYNKNIFDDGNVPYPSKDWTWEDFRETAKKLTKGEGPDKIWGAVLPTWAQTWSAIATQAGATYYKEGMPNLTDPRFEDAVMLRYNMTMVDKSVETLAENLMSKVHYAKAFSTGKYGMLVVGEWSIGQLKGNFGDEKPFEYDIQVLPHPKGTNPITWGSSAWVGISKNSSQEKKDAAFKFAEFMNSDEGSIVSARLNWMPARSSEEVKKAFAENVPEFLKNVDALFEDYEFCEEKPTGKGSSIYYKILDEESQLILTGDKGAKEALQEGNKRIEEELAN